MLDGQDVTLWQSQDVILQFSIADCAGIQAAEWFAAFSPDTLDADRDLELSVTGGSITVVDAANAVDLLVSVTVTGLQTAALPTGRRYHECWLVDALGRAFPVASGTLIVKASLRATA